MPRYIEQLTENITPASGDWLWIVDVSAGATDQDRKLSVGKLALLATANVFAEIVTASKGIAFPVTPVASADAHTLDDYEEGTWTPVVFGSVTEGTYQLASFTGTYTKVGRVVTYSYNLQFAAAVTGGGAGNLVIGGFPFTSAGGNQGFFGIYHFGISTTSAIPWGGPSDGSATSIVISTTAAGGQTIEAIGIVVANAYLRSAGHYIV